MARVMVHGATGFSGRLISGTTRAAGLDVIVAGRDRARLKALATSLGVSKRVVQLGNPAGFDCALEDIEVMLNVAGSFVTTASPVLDACMRTNTHYLDVSGELPSFVTSHEYDATVRDRGVMVMPKAVFVMVASGCIAAHVLQTPVPPALGPNAIASLQIRSRGTRSGMPARRARRRKRWTKPPLKILEASLHIARTSKP